MGTQSSIRYSILDPTGNITGLVEDEVPVCLQPQIATELMRSHPEVEQVGFVSVAGDAEGQSGAGVQAVLRMAGGEFCGNATMCAAAWFARRAGLRRGTVVLGVSGTSEPVTVRLEQMEADSFAASVCMPRALAMETLALCYGESHGVIPIVRMEGISHAVIEQTSAFWWLCEHRAEAERAVRQWCASLGADGLGIMFVEGEGQERRLTPLVYVPASGTVFWESSCASGSAAVGMYVGEKNLVLLEPGGTLRVEYDSSSGETWLHGAVTWYK